MRIALAANAASGGGLDPAPLAAAMRRAGAEEVVVGGCEPEELERLAAARPDRLAVAAGDGTIAPVAALAGRLGVPLAVLPAGTANDFARANGLPDDPDAAAALAAGGRSLRRLDLGRLADGRPFVNVASAGMAATAARRARPLKRRLGALAYAAGAVRAALSEQPLAVTVRVDGADVFAGKVWQLMVAVTGAFGAGASVGAADPGDGRLDVIAVRAGSRLSLARHAIAWRRSGSEPAARRDREKGSDPSPHRSEALSRRNQGSCRGRVVEVGLPAGAALNVDGELRSGGLERVTIEPGAFALVVG